MAPQTKIFLHIWCWGPNINMLCKFEGPTMKIKNFKILTVLGAGPYMGPPNKNIKTDIVSGP